MRVVVVPGRSGGAAPGAALPAVLRRDRPPVSQRLWCVWGLAAHRLELERELVVCPGDLSDDVARPRCGAAVVAGRDALAVVRATNAVRRDAMSDLNVPPSLPANRSMNCWKPPSEPRPPYDAAMSKGGKKSGEKSARTIPKNIYQAELFRLQTEFVRLQEWARETGARIVIVFEGRDTAGKGGTIKRITEYLSPRVARIAALPAPTERERGQWYYQRYIAHLPARGEIVLFDRSWYNRAGVEKVMGFCTPQEHSLFLRQTPIFEQMLIDDGIILRKYWFSVSDEEQLRRFRSRRSDPVRQWKLSPMDLESIFRWEDYSRAKDEMMVHTDIPM